MYEKVNPLHPDKIADRIAGAIVDLSYKKEKEPKVAVEVLIGHGECHIINETSVHITQNEIRQIVKRIAGNEVCVDYKEVAQDANLANNQKEKIRCGDNGIFKGVPITEEQKTLSLIARKIYSKYKSDGKYILSKGELVICQSNAPKEKIISEYKNAKVNPIGDWTGGINVDTGATNRKLGSDMGDSVTGGGLHGKDLSKADVSINIYVWLKAQKENRTIELSCGIGDEYIDGKPYDEIVSIANEYIWKKGGFERFAEWGLI